MAPTTRQSRSRIQTYSRAIKVRPYQTLKSILFKQKEGIAQGMTPRARLNLALFTYNFVNINPQGSTPAQLHANPVAPKHGWVRWKDLLHGVWRGPSPVLSWARGAVCIFPQEEGSEPVWVPERLIRPCKPPDPDPEETSTTEQGNQQEPHKPDQASIPTTPINHGTLANSPG